MNLLLQSESYREGWEAFYIGESEADCPYCFAHEPYDEEQWLKGYYDAMNHMERNAWK